MEIKMSEPFAEYANILECLSADGVQRMIDGAQRVFVSFWDLTIAQYWACIGGDFSPAGVTGDPSQVLTVAQVYWCKGFADFVRDFMSKSDALTIHPDEQEKAIMQQAHALPVTNTEGMLLFARDYFGLHSFKEAEGIRLCDYIIARKDAYNKRKYNKAERAIAARISK